MSFSRDYSKLIIKRNDRFVFDEKLLEQLINEQKISMPNEDAIIADNEVCNLDLDANNLDLDAILQDVLMNQDLEKDELLLRNFLKEKLEQEGVGTQEPFDDSDDYLRGYSSSIRDVCFKEIISQALDILELCKQQQQDFKIACEELKVTTKYDGNNPDSDLKAAGREVLQSVLKAKTECKGRQLPKLTKFIKGTTALIRNPWDDSAQIQHAKNMEEAIGINRNWGKLVGGAMLCLLGVAIIATSITVAVATFGASTPLSAAGLALGGSIIGAGILISAAAVSGAALAVAAGIFADHGRRGDIAVAGRRVQIEAEKNASLEDKITSLENKIEKLIGSLKNETINTLYKILSPLDCKHDIDHHKDILYFLDDDEEIASGVDHELLDDFKPEIKSNQVDAEEVASIKSEVCSNLLNQYGTDSFKVMQSQLDKLIPQNIKILLTQYRELQETNTTYTNKNTKK